MDKHFREIEREFNLLSRRFKQKRISGSEYKERLKKLRLKDREGRCWTIGARSGKWYYFDGDHWLESTPPSIQEKKAICIYCGYENDFTDLTCAYCGGNLDEEPIHVCPECGTKLEEEGQECPGCTGAVKTYPSTDTLERPETAADEILEEEGGPNFVFRSVGLVSASLFLSIIGLFSGLIFGVFMGTTPYFAGFINGFPLFFQEIHGKMIGGVVFGVMGGAAGFAVLAVLGLLSALVVNAVLAFMGGVRIRVDKFP